MRIAINHPEMFASVFQETTKVKLNRPLNGISTDTRKIEKGDLFVALKGNNYDGHNFLKQSEIVGASAVLVQDIKENLGIQQIMVDDPAIEIGKISNRWRSKFDIPIVGITGSNGKTTTKELLTYILSQEFEVHATKGNFNTRIGLPLSLLELEPKHDISILEMGASAPGEIKKLCEIANPTHGLITNIAQAHLEGFGSIGAIANEKQALFKSLNNGISFVNMADHFISEFDIPGKKVTFGLNHNCDFPADIYQEQTGSLTIILDTNVIKTNSFNLSYIKNCIAASAIAISMGISWKTLESKIKSFSAPKGRCFVKQVNNIMIIDDTYNANLTSVLAALNYLKALSSEGRCVFVFGDMYELGDESISQHRDVGKKCNELELDQVYTVGDYTKHTGNILLKSIEHRHFESKKSLILSLKDNLNPGDKVLFKGSRGMAMEKVIKGVFG